jgi:molecular chaperone GrpE
MVEESALSAMPGGRRRLAYRLRRRRYAAGEETPGGRPPTRPIEAVGDEQLAAEHDRLKDHYQRLRADFENHRKRQTREREETRRFAIHDFIGELLPIVDNFHRAVEASQQTNDARALTRGVELILQQLATLLASKGVEPVPAQGEIFNPQIHEAVAVDTESGAE